MPRKKAKALSHSDQYKKVKNPPPLTLITNYRVYIPHIPYLKSRWKRSKEVDKMIFPPRCAGQAPYTRDDAIEVLRIFTQHYVETFQRPAKDWEPYAVDIDADGSDGEDRFTLWDVQPWELVCGEVRLDGPAPSSRAIGNQKCLIRMGGDIYEDIPEEDD